MGSVRYEPKRGALKPYMQSAAVGAITRAKAEAIAASANSMLDPDEGYNYEDFEVVAMEGSGYVVRTKTDHARYSQNKNKTLTKAFHSNGG